MLNISRNAWVVTPLFTLVSALSAGCAHPQTVTLTSAAALAPAPTPAAAAPAPEAAASEEATAADSAGESKAAATVKKPDEAMSFEALSAALGGDNKLGLDMNETTEAPTRKGLSANGYAAVGAAHQTAAAASGTHTAGDIKVSGGITAAAVRAAAHEQAGRLRACYEHGLTADPHLAGRVTVSFSVDEHGTVSDLDAESDAIPADVMSCVKDAFSAMTFAPPKAPPAKIVYPVDFNKDS